MHEFNELAEKLYDKCYEALCDYNEMAENGKADVIEAITKRAEYEILFELICDAGLDELYNAYISCLYD